MKNIFVIASLVLAFAAAQTNASLVIFSNEDVDVVVSDPVSVGDGSENLLAVTLSIVGKDLGGGAYAANIFTGLGEGNIGILGPLHQQQVDNFGITTSPTAAQVFGSDIATGIDSHFLVLGDTQNIVAPFENGADANTSAEATDASGAAAVAAFTGFSGILGGNFGLAAGTATGQYDLAYLVVPDGSEVTVNFQTASANIERSAPVINTSFIVQSEIIPEPSTAILLGLGLVGLVGLRRRK